MIASIAAFSLYSCKDWM